MTLQRKLNGMERDIAAIQAKLDDLEREAARIEQERPDEAAEIRRNINQLQEVRRFGGVLWRTVCRRVRFIVIQRIG